MKNEKPLNVLMNCDVFEALPNISDDRFDIIIADPPYDWPTKTRIELLLELKRIAKNWIFIYSDWKHPYPKPDQLCIWRKPGSTKPNTLTYFQSFEFVYIYGEGRFPKEVHWSQKDSVWEERVDVIHKVPKVEKQLLSEDQPRMVNAHPYRKPPEQIRKIFRNHTQPGQSVFDPFAGSGVVLDVAHEMGLEYTGCENDPKAWVFQREPVDYVDIVKQGK